MMLTDRDKEYARYLQSNSEFWEYDMNYLKKLTCSESENFSYLVSLYQNYSNNDIDNHPISRRIDIISNIKRKSDETLGYLFPDYKKEINEYNNLTIFRPYIPEGARVLHNHASKKLIGIEISLPSFYSSTGSLNHEKVHALFMDNVDMKGFNYFYSELLPLFVEPITNKEIEDRSGVEDLLINCYCDILVNLISGINNLYDEKSYDLSDSMLASVINNHMYKYMISNACANVLFERYLDNPQEMIINLGKIMNGSISIEQFLDYYDASLDSPDILPFAQKQLSMCLKTGSVHQKTF